ncbi:MAG TPA: cysteine desulfurase family protein [Candidatus Sulfotelmatobacter sp.]|jgi:cysteine desulfurase|nr:cysteine desulfurase family protein [Candidatus Sulfotelmatobacter sp.]
MLSQIGSDRGYLDRIYFDHSATTPLDPRVLAAMGPYLGGAFGNASSLYHEGRVAREAVETARAQVAGLIGAEPDEIIFTASGTEADNLALIGAVRASGKPGHVVSSSIEHAAILETCKFLAKSGTKITHLTVDGDGIVEPSGLLRALQSNVTLVSVMAANNVVGTIQPIEELAHLTKLHGVLFHADAVQAGGKIPLDVNRLNVDLLSLSAHKLHGPKGIGALYVRRGVPLSPIVFGGGQERGLRSATENVAGIVGFGEAAAIAQNELAAEATRLVELREHIAAQLSRSFPRSYIFGHASKRLPGHLSFGFRGQEREVGKVLIALDQAGVAVSAGSACSANHSGEPSSVLLAMGYDSEQARGLLRVSLGRFNTKPEVDRLLDILRLLVTTKKTVAANVEAVAIA